MAAAKHGGYREHEFVTLAVHSEISSRKDYRYSDDVFGHGRERVAGRAHVSDRGRRGDSRERVGVRVIQRDIKERKVRNDYHSSPNKSNSGISEHLGVKFVGLSAKAADREPGELSSDSGSDTPDVPDSVTRSNEVDISENGATFVPKKKMRLSPDVRDTGDKLIKCLSKGNAHRPSGLLHVPPLPHQVLRPLCSDKIASNKSEHSSLEVKSTSGAVQCTILDSPMLSAISIPDQEQENVVEVSHLEDEDLVSTRHLAMSRWTDEDSSMGDEDEVSEVEGKRKKRKKMYQAEHTRMTLNQKGPSPEIGEVSREVSDGGVRGQPKSYVSTVAGHKSAPVSGNKGQSNKTDYLDADVDAVNGYSVSDQADKDSEGVKTACRTPESVASPQRSINMLKACRNVNEFERLNKIDEGTYGVVFRARDKRSGEIVALKKLKMEKEMEGFPLTSLREINILLSLHHPSIVAVKEVVVGDNLDSIFMVMEYMEHDLKGLMEAMKQPFSQSEVKCLMLQLLHGVKFLHDNWVLHRDLKTSNLLLNNCGELKICDFGLARHYGSPLKLYTHLVVTLWYRAPELLLASKKYSTAIDMWSLGCIMAELLAKEPLFNGKNEIEQLCKIFKILGTPNEKIWPGFAKLPGARVNYAKQPYNKLREKFPRTSFSGGPVLSDAGFDLLNKLLTYDPEQRITAEDALNHGWFHEVPLPKSKDFMPTFPAQHAQDRHLRRIMKSPDPLEEQRQKEFQLGDLIGTAGLFG